MEAPTTSILLRTKQRWIKISYRPPFSLFHSERRKRELDSYGGSYFDYYLKEIGQPFPKVTVQKTTDPLVASFSITAPQPIKKTEVYWAKSVPTDLKADDGKKREWMPLPAVKTGGNTYDQAPPPEAAEWFALVSDDRPVTVSSDMMKIVNRSPR